MTVQDMTCETVPAVAALEAAQFSMPWRERDIRGELENPWAIWLTAMERERLAGYLGVQYGPDGGDILTIATDPDFRGRGVARALISAMAERLREKNLQWLTLEVRPSNESALGLYRAMGFREVGRRPRFYSRPVEDAILMTLYFREEDSC